MAADRAGWTEQLPVHEFLDSTKYACTDRRHRDVLGDLQARNWAEIARSETGSDARLAALVIERGQMHLVMETPNHENGEVFCWDSAGLFRLGTIIRFDQSVGSRDASVLDIYDLERDVIERLGARAELFPACLCR